MTDPVTPALTLPVDEEENEPASRTPSGGHGQAVGARPDTAAPSTTNVAHTLR